MTHDERAPMVFDERTLDDLHALDGTGQALRELAAMFLQNATEQQHRLAQAAAAGDMIDVRLAAHSLKGSAATFGLGIVASISEGIEDAARRDIPPSAPTLSALRASLDEASQVLLHHLRSRPPNS